MRLTSLVGFLGISALALASARCSGDTAAQSDTAPGRGQTGMTSSGAGIGGTGGSSAADASAGRDGSGNAGAGGASGGAGQEGAGGARDDGGDAAAGPLCNAGDCNAIVNGFDGYLFHYVCGEPHMPNSCPGTACVMNTTGTSEQTFTKDFVIKGDPTKTYQIDFTIKGIVEAKNYAGGTRRSSASMDSGPTGNDLWYEAGTVPLSTYESYELHVTPKVQGAANDYYLNARDGTDEHDGNTWVINYAASIKVPGGGTITYRTFDSNCAEIMNCGPNSRTAPVCMPRIVDLTGAVPPPPPGFSQPPANAQGSPGQWFLIDVTDVRAL